MDKRWNSFFFLHNDISLDDWTSKVLMNNSEGQIPGTIIATFLDTDLSFLNIFEINT